MGTTFSKTFFFVMRCALLDPANNTSFTRLGVFGLRKKGDRINTPIMSIHVNVAVVVASQATFLGWNEVPDPVPDAHNMVVPQFVVQTDKIAIQQIFVSAARGRFDWIAPGEVKWETQVLLAHTRIENLMHVALEQWKIAKSMNAPGYPTTRRDALMLASHELARLSIRRLMEGVDAIVADSNNNPLACDFRPEMKPAPPLPATYPRDLMSAIAGE
jgi:hypothetical protein